MKKMLMLVALGVGSVASAQAPAAPFGIKKGTTIAQLLAMGAVSEGGGIYTLSRVPTPNSNFDVYGVVASKTYGVCKVQASSKTLENDSSGYKTRDMFSRLEAALIQKYGKGKKYDFLKHDSIWNGNSDWLMGIKTEDRVLTEYWPLEGKKLPAPLSVMGLTTEALSSTKGYVNVGYEFDNFEKCLRELQGNPGSGL